MSTKLPDFGKHHKEQYKMSLNAGTGSENKDSVIIYDKSAASTSPKSPKQTRSHPVLKFMFRSSLFMFLLVVALAGGAGVGLAFSLSKLPDVTMLQYYAPVETTEIYDDKGRVLTELHDEENRRIVKLEEVPEHVRNAVLAIEDSRFFQHQGVDFVGTLRAFKANLDKRGVVQGGSTITQQITKNLFLTPERTIQRKLAEAWLSAKIEQKYSKKQILELYLNQVYWGHNAYGIEAASETYFGKKAEKLTLEEGALLAGLLKGPEIFSPYHSEKRAKQRQKLVLSRMVENQLITADAAREAYEKPLKFSGIKHGQMRHPYFTSYVVALLKKKYGDGEILKGGLKVYTTMDSKLQTFAEDALEDHIRKLKPYRVEQSALVSIDVKTGQIKAMVGGTDFSHSSFNRAWQAQRQPGSSFKPFAYLTAFARGFSPANVEMDEPIQYRFGSYVWRPKNYGGGHRGAMTLQRALELSVNIIAVKVAEKAGLSNVVDTAHKLGIKSPLKDVLSLPLGSNEVTPLEMASAYATMASRGLYYEPTPILRIEDRFGKVLEDNSARTPQRVFAQEHVTTLIKVMKGVIARGTAPAAYFGRPAAGKTGTTSHHKDAWFVGYTPQFSTAVWVGNDTPVPMYGSATGGTMAAPLWSKYMKFAHEGLPVEDFEGAKGLMPLLAGIGTKKDEKEQKEKSYERLAALKEDAEKTSSTSVKIDPKKLVEQLQVPIDELLQMSVPTTAMNVAGGSQQNTSVNTRPVKTNNNIPSKNQPANQKVPTIPTNTQGLPVSIPTPAQQPKQPPKQKVIKELDQLIDELNHMQGQ